MASITATAALALVLTLGTVASALPCSPSGQTYTVCQSTWEDVGPGTYVDNDPNNTIVPSASATQAIASSGESGVWFIGTVNGGVWRTADIEVAEPVWVPVTDNQPVSCSAIASLAVSGATVLAGCGGSTSSEMGDEDHWNVLNTGMWGGIMKSTDQGATWSMTNFPANFYVSSLVIVGENHYVAAASAQFFDKDDGGIWVSVDGGNFWVQSFQHPTWDIVLGDAGMFAAVIPNGEVPTSVVYSADKGSSWSHMAEVDWRGNDMVPFYATLALSGSTLFVGGLTVKQSDSRKTGSGIFHIDSSCTDPAACNFTKLKGPKLDQDAMPKDRMALLVDPTNSSLLYVAGNAEATVWRVDWQRSNWTNLLGADTADGMEPHVDCRNFAFDTKHNFLLLVSDGGAFKRTKPSVPGGVWRSINGDLGAMEFLTAHWDNNFDRFVAGAQDNEVQISVPGSSATARAIGIVNGDGTVTAVDNVNDRLFGTIQFLGQRDYDALPPTGPGVRDDDDLPGLLFVQGKNLTKVSVPINKHFPDEQAFPYFEHPFALNENTQDVVVWVNGTASNPAPGGSGWWSFSIPKNATDEDDIPAPTYVADSQGTVLTFVAGGKTQGHDDPSILVAMNDTHFYYRSNATKGALQVTTLPTSFAAPVILTYDNKSQIILGPVSHAMTVSLGVCPYDSHVAAVTGWPRGEYGGPVNSKDESIYLTFDGGKTWKNIIGNLAHATQTPAMVRPSGLLIMPHPTTGFAVLTGTNSGVYVTFSDNLGTWSRLGDCREFPLVLTKGLSFDEKSDTIVAATMGRGVFKLANATSSVTRARHEQANKTCATTM